MNKQDQHLDDNPELKAKVSRNLLYLSILSIVMLFSGLTSAYLVTRADNFWISISMPMAFFISTGIIILSSLTVNLAVMATKKKNLQAVKLWLLITLGLGGGFVATQFMGYGELVEMGHHFTGNPIIDSEGNLMIKGEYGKDYTINFKGQTIFYENGVFYHPDGSEISSSQYMALQTANNSASSYMYMLTGLHAVHVAGGMIYLIILCIRVLMNRTGWKTDNKVKLISIYWHFVDVLWIYLFLFLYFIH